MEKTTSQSKTTQELLAESRSLRFSFTKPDTVAELLIEQTFSALPWHYYFGQILGAVGFSFEDCVIHVYFDELEHPLIYDEESNVTLIIHGHSRGKFCSAISLCHHIGYKPNAGDFTEIQAKNWRKFGYELEISSDL